MFIVSEVMLISYLVTDHKNQYGIKHNYYVDFYVSLCQNTS